MLPPDQNSYGSYGSAICLIRTTDETGHYIYERLKDLKCQKRDRDPIESGWCIDPWSPLRFIRRNGDNIEEVHLIHQSDGFTKWVSIDDLLIWNDHAPQH